MLNKETDSNPQPNLIPLHEYVALPVPRPRARFEQTNTRAKGEITRCDDHYNVWTKELAYKGRGYEPSMKELWWCCHAGHMVELLRDDQQVELTVTSNL